MKHLNSFITFAVALATGNAGAALAFSPSSRMGCTTAHRRVSSSTTTLASSTLDQDEDRYNTAELMSSDMEKARLSNQYSRYSHDDWLRHRASDRFFTNLFKFDKSPIIKNLLDEAAVLTATNS